MNNRNYQRELDKVIAGLAEKVPVLFLHSCCAPCSSYVLEYLSQYFRITVFYYNPNIYPEEEYRKRVVEQQRLIREMPLKHPVSFIEGDFDDAHYYEAVKGLEREPEGGARCRVCFALRLRAAARAAQEIGAEFFTTTLTTGPRKSAQTLYEVGKVIGEEAGVAYLPSDFKKRGGYEHSLAVCAAYGIYRQNYCGCPFSHSGAPEHKE